MKLLTVDEAAEVLRVNPRQIYRMVATNDIPHTRIGKGRGGAIRFESEQLSKWILEGGTNSAMADR